MTLTPSKLRVAVIGAGPSGLAACRHLSSKPDRFEFVCYEQCASVGGAWYYAEDNIDYDKLDDQINNNNDDKFEDDNASKTKTDDNSAAQSKTQNLQSPTYKNLRANSPVDVFKFPDFPFKNEHYIAASASSGTTEQLKSFVTHAEMLRYLRSYAKHFNLIPHIRLNTSAERVRRIEMRLAEDEKCSSTETANTTQYCVTSVNIKTDERFDNEIFDAVMVCVGRYSKPKWPVIKNLDKFGGKLMHTKYYRHPKQFSSSVYKKIIVMGGGYSGVDIALDLDQNSPTKKQVILSVHNEANVGNQERWRADCNVQVRPDIIEITGENEVKFADGSIEPNVDVVLIATGYYYDFPFLSEEDGLALSVDDQCLTPLYKHLIHINYPTLCFVGMIWTGLTLPQFDQQAKYFVAMLNGDFQLPSRDKMFEWVDNDLTRRLHEYKWPKRYAHKMGYNVQREYMASLCEESGISPFDPKLFDIEDVESEIRLQDPVKFKLKNYVY